MTEHLKGAIAMIAACTIWGLSAIYYKQLSETPPVEVLCHRTIWSVVAFTLFLRLQNRLEELKIVFRDRKLVQTLFWAAAMISTNWFFFIWSVHNDRATEASFGYYIFPLVAVVFGLFFFNERLSLMKWVSVVLATIAVLILAISQNILPFIALVLSITFGIYGMLKKQMSLGPVLSVTSEVILLLPLAIILLLYWHLDGTGSFGTNITTTSLLIFSGPMTAVPLMLFSYAARRVQMTSLGIIQYLNPSLQFFVAIFIFLEPFGLWHAMAFGLIWLALFIYSFASISTKNLI
ncbi:EamA family transporter RarD [Paracoccaceae bacterium]|nr:EamA family transporter RarD [Paracoccaceae bacterium]